jgi:hypothetical protein
MGRYRRETRAILAVLGAAALAGPALAAAPPQADYHPSMADMMTMAIQPRHTKLGLAGRLRNWTYAAFEASELRNAFTRIVRTIPVYSQTDTAEMINPMVKDPLANLEAAIKAKDGRAFDAAYAKLTETCNTCHETQTKGFIVIKAPDASSYPDQDFRARPGK